MVRVPRGTDGDTRKGAAVHRVLILSDHPLFGHCVESLLHGRAGVEIVGREASAEVAIERMGELRPDVVVVDSGVSERDATAVLRVLEAGQGCRVVALSRRDNTISVYRGEQRTVSDTGDLLAAIEAE